MGEVLTKAVFLDRDGVINEDTGYVSKPIDFHFIDGIFEFCRVAKANDYLLIVITNQAGIAKGYFTEKDFLELTEWMLEEFLKHGVQIDKVYYCPYHPDGCIDEYKKDSYERKPNPGMILKARDDFNIDLSTSILIGDKDSDIEAGIIAGVGSLFALKGRYEISLPPFVDIVSNFLQIEL